MEPSGRNQWHPLANGDHTENGSKRRKALQWNATSCRDPKWQGGGRRFESVRELVGVLQMSGCSLWRRMWASQHWKYPEPASMRVQGLSLAEDFKTLRGVVAPTLGRFRPFAVRPSQDTAPGPVARRAVADIIHVRRAGRTLGRGRTGEPRGAYLSVPFGTTPEGGQVDEDDAAGDRHVFSALVLAAPVHAAEAWSTVAVATHRADSEGSMTEFGYDVVEGERVATTRDGSGLTARDEGEHALPPSSQRADWRIELTLHAGTVTYACRCRSGGKCSVNVVAHASHPGAATLKLQYQR